jgi:hypothetical protein
MAGPTLLARYLARQKLSYPAFAQMVGADRARIHRCARGERKPGLLLALAIEKATDGAVPVSSWLAPRTAPRRSRAANGHT